MAKLDKLDLEQLEKVAGGSVYDDPSVTSEEILADARKTAAEWAAAKRPKDQALELLPRYFYIEGRTTKEQIAQIVREAYA